MPTNRKVLISLVLIVIASFLVVGCGEYNLPAVAVTAVAIDQGNQTLVEGDTVQLTATVTPSHASDKSVTWSSGNTAVATVSGIGRVTGETAGSSTTITVATTDGGKTDTIEVTVTGDAL